MGGMKDMMDEANDLGWWSIERFVCVNCVEDEYLQSLIEDNLSDEYCSYCDSGDQALLSAPVDSIMEAIAVALHTYFSSPESSGLPRDGGGWLIDPIDTDEALFELPLEGNQDLIEDISSSFVNTSWVPTAQGWWGNSHHSVILKSAWERFCIEVKEKSRYFFFQTKDGSDPFSDHEEISALSLLESIGSTSEEFGLIPPRLIPKEYYRVRPGHGHVNFQDIGPPKTGVSGGGRMNPEGISYFYLSDNPHTAIAETRLADCDEATLALFEVKQDLQVLDFSILPFPPSKFKPDSYAAIEKIKFWWDFVNQVSKPVGPSKSIDYIPTQILTEYFAKAFRMQDGTKIDGFVFESATSSVGKNLVLFPESHNGEGWETLATLLSTQNIMVKSSIDGYEIVK
jgi:hypothetical protein